MMHERQKAQRQRRVSNLLVEASVAVEHLNNVFRSLSSLDPPEGAPAIVPAPELGPGLAAALGSVPSLGAGLGPAPGAEPDDALVPALRAGAEQLRSLHVFLSSETSQGAEPSADTDADATAAPLLPTGGAEGIMAGGGEAAGAAPQGLVERYQRGPVEPAAVGARAGGEQCRGEQPASSPSRHQGVCCLAAPRFRAVSL